MASMTNDELKKIAGKIANCLALAASENPGEAEAARRQADALMKKYCLTIDDVAAADVHEISVVTGTPCRPPLYLSTLSRVVSDAFGCGGVFSRGYFDGDTRAIFFGLGAKPELAAYTFDILRRQIARDRAAYLATIKRFKKANKIRKANLFCEAWVYRISHQVQAFAGNEREKCKIDAYKQKHYGSRLQVERRISTIPKQDSDWQACAAGHNAAEKVLLHKPVPSNTPAKRLTECH